MGSLFVGMNGEGDAHVELERAVRKAIKDWKWASKWGDSFSLPAFEAAIAAMLTAGAELFVLYSERAREAGLEPVVRNRAHFVRLAMAAIQQFNAMLPPPPPTVHTVGLRVRARCTICDETVEVRSIHDFPLVRNGLREILCPLCDCLVTSIETRLGMEVCLAKLRCDYSDWIRNDYTSDEAMAATLDTQHPGWGPRPMDDDEAAERWQLALLLVLYLREHGVDPPVTGDR